MIMRDVVVNTDADGVLFRKEFIPSINSSGSLSIDQFYFLDERYLGIDKEAKATIETTSKKGLEEVTLGLVRLAGSYRVSYDSLLWSARKAVESAKISEELEKVLQGLYPKEMNIFTHSEEESMQLYAAERIQPVIPDTKITVYGTVFEYFNAEITGRTLKVLNSEDRAKKAKELTGERKSINIGHDQNDLPMLEAGSVAFYLTEKPENGKGNIVRTNLRDLPRYLQIVGVT